MTVFFPVDNARTVDFHANDIGYVPSNAGHYIENTGDTDVVFLEMFATDIFKDVSLNQWLRRAPVEIVQAHLASIRRAWSRFLPRSWRSCSLREVEWVVYAKYLSERSIRFSTTPVRPRKGHKTRKCPKKSMPKEKCLCRKEIFEQP